MVNTMVMFMYACVGRGQEKTLKQCFVHLKKDAQKMLQCSQNVNTYLCV